MLANKTHRDIYSQGNYSPGGWAGRKQSVNKIKNIYVVFWTEISVI